MGASKKDKKKKLKATDLIHNHIFQPEDHLKVKLKKEEATKVIGDKMKLLLEKKLSFLEYVEIREELKRLTNFKENLEKKLSQKE